MVPLKSKDSMVPGVLLKGKPHIIPKDGYPVPTQLQPLTSPRKPEKYYDARFHQFEYVVDQYLRPASDFPGELIIDLLDDQLMIAPGIASNTRHYIITTDGKARRVRDPKFPDGSEHTVPDYCDRVNKWGRDGGCTKKNK